MVRACAFFMPRLHDVGEYKLKAMSKMKLEQISLFVKKITLLMAGISIVMSSVLLFGCDKQRDEPERVSVQDNSFSKMLIGSWMRNVDNGYVVLTFESNQTITIVQKVNNIKEEKNGRYSFDSDKMQLTTSIKDWEVCSLTSITDNGLVLNGNQYFRTTSSVLEEEDPYPVAKEFKGNGTKSSPYLISDASELRKLAKDVENGNSYSGKYFKMTNDITINKNVLTDDGELNGDGSNFELWFPIGYSISISYKTKEFSGNFDGDGHKISGVYIHFEELRDIEYLALFGYVKNASISNLILVDSYIHGKGDKDLKYINHGTSGIVGTADGFVEINNCHNYATIIQEDYYNGSAAGILAYFKFGSGGSIINCTNHGKITADYVFGITDGCDDCVIDMCVNYGNLIGYEVYGIAGGGKMRNCVNIGDMSANIVIGIGSLYSDDCPTIYNSCNMGKLEGKDIMGIMWYITGYNNPAPKIINCLNMGTYSGGMNTVYGIVGKYENVLVMKNNYCLTIPGVDMELLGSSVIVDKTKNGVQENNRFVSEDEIKSQAFLNELNANAIELEKETGIKMNRWKTSKNGYPILDFIEE